MHIRIAEALRYAGVRGKASPELTAQAGQIAAMLEQRLTPRSVYRVFPLERRGGVLALSGTELLLPGNSAEKMLSECSHAVLLACTVGSEFDSILRHEQAKDMSSALLTDACGSAFVEAVCDEAEKEIAGRFPGKYLTDRFSPGYGDLPLELQSDICSLLNVQRRIGVTLSPSLLMNPCKSVTAVIGIADKPQAARVRGCAFCSLNKNCDLRKGGHSCAI